MFTKADIYYDFKLQAVYQERKNRLYIWSVARPVVCSKVVAGDLANAAGDCMYSCCCCCCVGNSVVVVIAYRTTLGRIR